MIFILKEISAHSEFLECCHELRFCGVREFIEYILYFKIAINKYIGS